MSRLIRAVIDKHALRHNLSVIRARAGRARVIAVVKANAYGHGLAAPRSRWRTPTRSRWRASRRGWRCAPPDRRAHRAARGRLHPRAARGCRGRAAGPGGARCGCRSSCWRERLRPQRFALWMKIDTGMNRLGFATADVRRGARAHPPPGAARAAPDDAPGVRQRTRRRGDAGAAAAFSRRERRTGAAS